MFPRILLSLALGGSIVFEGAYVSAEPLPRLNAAVVCMRSAAQENEDVDAAPGHFCLLRLPAWFEDASLEVTPRAALSPRRVMKRLGAELEFKF